MSFQLHKPNLCSLIYESQLPKTSVLGTGTLLEQEYHTCYRKILTTLTGNSADRYGQKRKSKEYGALLNGPMRTVHFPQPYFDKNPYPDPPKMKPGPTYIKPKGKEGIALPPGMVIPCGKNKLPGKEYFDKFPEYKPNKYITAYDLIKPRKHTGGNFIHNRWRTRRFTLRP
ncbi:hypothetical protein NQ318_015608 [Aromia moschata]|uniref:Uncharacterized protein n=1 Tax=Aromia moschata TaxID=1265417 RepID=A0AAV8XQP8_9CUCU|nr:hypothetical protein NQ318_015608 [Aromia moschata]